MRFVIPWSLSGDDGSASARPLDTTAFPGSGILASWRPFLYFTDMSGDLREAIRKGRLEFLSQFPSLARDEVQRQLPESSIRRFSHVANGTLQIVEKQKPSTISIPISLDFDAKIRVFANKRRAAWMAQSSGQTVSCSVISRRQGRSAQFAAGEFGRPSLLEPVHWVVSSAPLGFEWRHFGPATPSATEVRRDSGRERKIGCLSPAEAAIALNHPFPRRLRAGSRTNGP